MSNPEDKNNIGLRAQVLDFSLRIEFMLSAILRIFLNIYGTNRKKLSNKSGSFSSRDKIDLLYDLEIFNKNEYDAFVLFTEFRNQFVHNIECTSFKSAIEFLGKDKGRRLARMLSQPEVDDEEYNTKCFAELFAHCIRIIKTKHQERVRSMQEIADLVISAYAQNAALIDVYFDFEANVLLMFEEELLNRPQNVKWVAPMMTKLNANRAGSLEKMEKLTHDSKKNLSRSAVTKLLFGRNCELPDAMKEVFDEYFGVIDDRKGLGGQ